MRHKLDRNANQTLEYKDAFTRVDELSSGS